MQSDLSKSADEKQELSNKINLLYQEQVQSDEKYTSALHELEKMRTEATMFLKERDILLKNHSNDLKVHEQENEKNIKDILTKYSLVELQLKNEVKSHKEEHEQLIVVLNRVKSENKRLVTENEQKIN
eukprot:Pgem_evm1s7372